MSVIKAQLGGNLREYTCDSDTDLLNAALDNGIDAPYSCMSGSCHTCKAELKAGKVDPGDDDFLDPDEKDQGMILTCQATPKSEAVEIAFVHE